MLTGLVFLTVFLMGFIAISIFKKHMLINLAIFMLAIGVLATYFEGGYSGFTWVFVALISICGFELYEMSKMRW